MFFFRNTAKGAIKKDNHSGSNKGQKQPMRQSNTVNNAANIASQKPAPNPNSFAAIVAKAKSQSPTASVQVASPAASNKVEVTENAAN